MIPTLEAGFHGPEQKDTLASLWQFYSANAFGTLPPVSFEGMGLSTGLTHGLVGNTIWEGFW